jgi:hypothetical protein
MRMTLQPLNAPNGEAEVRRMLDHIDGDHMLLFSTDYPHWHFDGGNAMPPHFPQSLHRKVMVDNPLETYGRLEGALQ